jgi:hypothetical protein
MNIGVNRYFEGKITVEEITEEEALSRLKAVMSSLGSHIGSSEISSVFDMISSEETPTLYYAHIEISSTVQIEPTKPIGDYLRLYGTQNTIGPFNVSFIGEGKVVCAIFLNKIRYLDSSFYSDAHDYINFDAYKSSELSPVGSFMWNWPGDIDHAIEQTEEMLEFFRRMKALNEPITFVMDVD